MKSKESSVSKTVKQICPTPTKNKEMHTRVRVAESQLHNGWTGMKAGSCEWENEESETVLPLACCLCQKALRLLILSVYMVSLNSASCRLRHFGRTRNTLILTGNGS